MDDSTSVQCVMWRGLLWTGGDEAGGEEEEGAEGGEGEASEGREGREAQGGDGVLGPDEGGSGSAEPGNE